MKMGVRPSKFYHVSRNFFSELICFNFWYFKITLRRQNWILPEVQVGRDYGTEIFQIPVRIAAPKNNSKTMSVM